MIVKYMDVLRKINDEIINNIVDNDLDASDVPALVTSKKWIDEILLKAGRGAVLQKKCWDTIACICASNNKDKGILATWAR